MFLHDYHLACEISAVRTLALMFHSRKAEHHSGSSREDVRSRAGRIHRRRGLHHTLARSRLYSRPGQQ